MNVHEYIYIYHLDGLDWDCLPLEESLTLTLSLDGSTTKDKPFACENICILYNYSYNYIQLETDRPGNEATLVDDAATFFLSGMHTE